MCDGVVVPPLICTGNHELHLEDRCKVSSGGGCCQSGDGWRGGCCFLY